MNRVLNFISRLFIGRTAYAIDTYKYKEKDSDISVEYYRVSKVVIVEVFLSSSMEVSYYVKDYSTGEEWGDSTENVFLTKKAAAREFIKLCKL